MGENYNQSFKRRCFLRTASVGAALGSSEVLKARNENDVVIPEKEMLQNLINCLGGPWPDPCPLKANHRETIRIKTD